jgi:AcrR family transcriptional regulator
MNAVGRPVNADSERTRARILETARSMVSSHGIDGVSIRDIAREAGVSLATVHHYFGTKDALHEACIDDMYRELAELEAALAPALGPGRTFAEAVEEIVRTAFRFAVEHAATQRLLMRTVVERGLDPERREGVLKPFLAKASVLLSARSSRSPNELRFVLQSLTYLAMRYSIAQDEELTAVADVDDPALARRRVEDHLVEVATRLLSLESEASPKRRGGRAR